MAPPQHLLWVNSLPTKVSEDSWTKWYLDEHLGDLVRTKCVSNGAFYQEVPLDPSVKHDRPYLAIYQSDYPAPMASQEYKNAPAGGGKTFEAQNLSPNAMDHGDFDARNYELVQDFDPNGVGNGKRFRETSGTP